MDDSKRNAIRHAVVRHYGKVATAGGCCRPTCCNTNSTAAGQQIPLTGYSEEEAAAVPSGANMGLGCGNPQAIAKLKSGEIVLDLGCGGGFDCFLAARQVGDTGRVIGVDMTPEMLEKARTHAQKGDYPNVEFRLGEMENLPLADASVDVIISNCALNLSPDKPRAIAEAFRVLKPGGRLAITDIVAIAEMPEEMREDMALYTGCVAGAPLISEIAALLQATGFVVVCITPLEESHQFIKDWEPAKPITSYVVAATIAAHKPPLPAR
ncbi:MAG: arsenite methyltransferase [Formivibrio sp.]|nr:arsenite methyltransferase [Formivibrio sp.]